MKMYARVVTVVAAMLALATPAWSAVIAYEYFDYPTNPTHIIGQSGGYGWSGAWYVSNVYPSAVYTNEYVAGYVEGWLTNSAYPFAPAGGFVSTDTRDVHLSRDLATPLNLAVDANYYFSFLIKVYERNIDNHMLFFHDAGAFILAGFRERSGGDLDARAVCGAGTQGVQGPYYRFTNYFIVGKIEAHASGNDYVRMNVYQDGNTVPVTEPVSYQVNSAGASLGGNIYSIRLRHANASYNGLPTLYDELRFGESWAEVAVPEPVGLGLVVVALGLLRRRG